jgi:hypothetical protein
VKPVETKTFRNNPKEVDSKLKGKVQKKLSPKPKKNVPSKPLQSSSSEISENSSTTDTLKSSDEALVLKRTSNSICIPFSQETSTPKKTPKSKRTSRKSLPKETKLSTPKAPIPKSESSSEEKLRSPKAIADVPVTPEKISDETKKISPCVTMSRGKDNARKEMKKKIQEGKALTKVAAMV